MSHTILRRWQVFAIFGTLTLLLGVGIILNPLVATKGVLIAFGLAAIGIGVYGVFAGESDSAPGDTFWGALFCALLGIVSIIAATLTWQIMAYVIAVQCIVASIVQGVLIVEMRNERLLARALGLSAVLSLLLGVLLFLVPVTTLLALLAFFGFCMLVVGVLFLILAIDAREISVRQGI